MSTERQTCKHQYPCLMPKPRKRSLEAMWEANGRNSGPIHLGSAAEVMDRGIAEVQAERDEVVAKALALLRACERNLSTTGYHAVELAADDLRRALVPTEEQT